MSIITNFPIFRKNLIEYSEFSVYFACNKRSTVCFKIENPDYSGCSYELSVKISVLYSEYPDFSDFSPPIIDYNPKIIRFYRFFGVIDY